MGVVDESTQLRCIGQPRGEGEREKRNLKHDVPLEVISSLKSLWVGKGRSLSMLSLITGFSNQIGVSKR